ncbi:MAG: DUF1295 domain-containing protein [Bacilli bacterium]|nr:DUF1295 domain-containing protein [Bacilli bacterium]
MKKKISGLLILLIVYLIAALIGVLYFIAMRKYGLNVLVSVLLADMLATIFVWLMGILFKTSSVYDPYWSLQTFVIYVSLVSYFNNWNLGTILVLVAIIIYSIRLTGNFIIGFDSLSYVDWRYKMLKEKSGKLYQLVNLFGICMFPTLVVYAASVPLMIYAEIGVFSPLNIIGLAVVIGGVVLELISDMQMKKFISIRKDRSEIINIGLWKYSRHPNYLGEIMIWFGFAFILIFSYPVYWYYLAGAVINLLMFLFISIPMEEKHLLEYKPGIIDYQKSTSMLLLLPRKRQKAAGE